MKRTGMTKFIAGFIAGAAIFGGAALGAPATSIDFVGRGGATERASLAVYSEARFSAVRDDEATGIIAQPRTAGVVIDGQLVDIEGYIIGGNHYFQLRGVSAALASGGKDFSVVWDGAGNRVIIDTSRGYAPDETGPPYATATAPAMSLDEMRMEIVRLTNIERARAGLPELEVHQGLTRSAQAKAQDFLDSHYFSHRSPVYGASYEMIRNFVPRARDTGENIAGWTESAQDAFDGWLCSPEHLGLMLDPVFTHIGVGVVEGAGGSLEWVQHLARIP